MPLPTPPTPGPAPRYTTPNCKDTCVAFCHFNAIGYKRPVENLREFQRRLEEASIPFYTAEVLIAGREPDMPPPTLTLRAESALFHKEAAWNRLTAVIPTKYTKILFCDADILFQTPDWVDQCSTLLDSCDAIQYFENRYNVWQGQPIGSNLKSFAFYAFHKKKNAYLSSHPGFGWGIRRDFLDKLGGFYDRAIIGSGDQFFSKGLLDMKMPANLGWNSVLEESWAPYRKRAGSLKPRIGYLPGTIYHMCHGSVVNRKYCERHEFFKNFGAWNDEVYRNADGLWELRRPEKRAEALAYFAGRNEDEEPGVSTFSPIETLLTKYPGLSVAECLAKKNFV